MCNYSCSSKRKFTFFINSFIKYPVLTNLAIPIKNSRELCKSETIPNVIATTNKTPMNIATDKQESVIELLIKYGGLTKSQLQ